MRELAVDPVVFVFVNTTRVPWMLYFCVYFFMDICAVGFCCVVQCIVQCIVKCTVRDGASQRKGNAKEEEVRADFRKESTVS